MSQILAPFQLLELNVISAQDLASVGRNMKTYAVAWVHPDRKLSTRVDTQGHTNPTWNDKFVFRVDEEFLYSDTSAIMIEIYALHWFKDVHVGTVRVLVGNLIPPPARPFHNNRAPVGMRFVALQVRRPSGRPQGILNIGVAVLDSSMRSMPLYALNSSAVGYRHLMGEKDAYEEHNHLSPHVFSAAAPKPEQLRRTKSDSSSMIGSEAVARQRMAMASKEKASSEVSGKSGKSHKKKRRSKASSVVSSVSGKSGKGTSSVLSDVLPWKVKNGKASSAPSASDVPVQPPIQNDVVDIVDNDNHKAPSPIHSVSEAPSSEMNTNNNTNERHVPVTKITYEVKASPKPQFHNSPAPNQFKNSPARQFKNSPKPQFKNSPAPQYMVTPAPPQFMVTPKPQFRNSPAVSKFNPAVGFGGSHRGTPMHPFGKVNGGFEYATPRRSNLGNMGPIVLTESELGPSPSEVAAAMARRPVVDEGENSTVGGWSLDEQSVEGLQSKLERWRTELPPVIDRGEFSSLPTTSSTKTSRHTRRHTDGDNGLFSCFSNICGIECTIVCGGDSKGKKNRRRRTPSADNASFL
ncbi:uncharacterized protein LOC133301181 [Gastrolobium bilobum]|uniref:uncharacterized protein LOC133301181 n=1 Tax=Gastrolobium bilobum TaxID=150636 RepID=UPI002AB1D36D|nr:uncharacterized protein LOC133301181 [Gastrolobium bilobum]